MKIIRHVNQESLYKSKQVFGLSIASLLIVMFIFIAGCKKDEIAEFTSGFSYEMVNENYVMFTNESTGEYFSITYDFGNGTTQTTTEKKIPLFHYYPEAGEYQVTVKTLNYYGDVKSVSKTVSIASTDVIVSFTAEVDPYRANYVNLTNTSQGTYDSFKWVYNDVEVEGEMEIQVYFPNEGTYDVELVITKYNVDLSLIQQIAITQDDPANLPNLVWSDEFDYLGIPDPEKWNMEIGGNGWGNNELQYYTDSESNAMVDNGILTITAREESYGGRDYTSARITTENKFDFKYGRIEARIKLPYGQGLWPAFWLLGANSSSVGWPACGEIDIMEMVGGNNGGDNTVYSTLHWDENGHAEYGEPYTLEYGIFANDYHVFSLEWDSETIIAYVDGIQFYLIDITPTGLSAFQNNFFVVLNLAVGGNWPGPPNAETVFPQTMEIDYVRVFQEPAEK
ncbi:MAG: family 16 glycosylhydrolase [Bacteroidales bacterium]